MNLYRCTYSFSTGYTYSVDAIADSEQHARELAWACTREKAKFGDTISAGKWNVATLESGYSGPARVKDYDAG